jgi:hypothetical protein
MIYMNSSVRFKYFNCIKIFRSGYGGCHLYSTIKIGNRRPVLTTTSVGSRRTLLHSVLMSQDKNGTISYGQEGSRKVDGFSVE